MKYLFLVLLLTLSSVGYAQTLQFQQVQLQVNDDWSVLDSGQQLRLVSKDGSLLTVSIYQLAGLAQNKVAAAQFEKILTDMVDDKNIHLLQPLTTYRTNNGITYSLLQLKTDQPEGYVLGGSIASTKAVIAYTLETVKPPAQSKPQLDAILSTLQVGSAETDK